MSGLTVAATFEKPVARQLLHGDEPARLAYVGLDGEPRVVPVGFWMDDQRLVVATAPKSPKVAALRKHPRVALTIDRGAFPPKMLLIRGDTELDLCVGIPDAYFTASRRLMTAEQFPEWAALARSIYTQMVVITITPTWAKLIDYDETLPEAVSDLIESRRSVPDE
jgi:hypothetical protein